MDGKNWSENIVENDTVKEKILLLVMAVISGYMLWGATQFTATSSARFPRLVATVVLVGSLLLLVREFLPGPLRRALISEGAAFEASDEFAEKEEGTEEMTPQEEGISSVDRPLHDSVFTALVVVGYAVLGYAIGLLWASPIFVAVYARWFRITTLRTGLLTGISFGIAYVFMIVLNVELDAGAILLPGGVPWL